MKALFISFNGYSAYNGISKKKLAQIKGFRACGVDIGNCYFMVRSDQHRVWMLDDTILVDYGKGILARLKQLICFGPIIQIALTKQIDFIYIRHDFNANPFLIRTARFLSRNNVKLILELPTYPYDKEFKNTRLKAKISLWIDMLFRHKYASYMYRIVTYSPKSKIWNKQTIQISNGVDFDLIKLKRSGKEINSFTSLNLISVAEVHDWHALDRLIHGMGEYYLTKPTIDVFFHVVGGIGPIEKTLFNKLVIRYGLEKQVLFYGPLYDDVLDQIFDIADIGVGSLGRHRSQISYIKTIKNREYAARGIPFFYSEIDEDFEEKEYTMKVPANETPIDIRNVIEFYLTQKMSSQSIRDSILNLSWKNQIIRIVDEITHSNSRYPNAIK